MPKYLINLGVQVGRCREEVSFEVEDDEPPTEEDLNKYFQDALSTLADTWAVYEEINND